MIKELRIANMALTIAIISACFTFYDIFRIKKSKKNIIKFHNYMQSQCTGSDTKQGCDILIKYEQVFDLNNN